MERVLVIGGVAAGLSAASRVRRLAPSAPITVLERGAAAGYSACGLPLFLAGRVRSMEELRVHPPEFFRRDRGLDLRLEHEVLALEPGRRRVLARHPRGETWFAYDRLILAAGARARRGSDEWGPERRLFAANTWAQAARLDAAVRGGEFRRWAVVGGGYIGCEVAEALAARGCQVTLWHAHGRLLHGFDQELAAELPSRLEQAGVQVRLGERVRDPLGAADAAVLCHGLEPAVELAASAGIGIGKTGAIAVDERQQTSQTGVYAAGDCAEARSLLTGAPTWIPLATAANRQGRIAGENAAGGNARFPGVLGTLAVELGGVEWGRTGLTLEQARAAGYAAEVVEVTAGSQAGYLTPQPITLRLIHERSSGRALGCHLRGAPGTVTGRLDVAATALAGGLRLEQIEQLDLAYAPELAPLYEPLLIAAHIANRH